MGNKLNFNRKFIGNNVFIFDVILILMLNLNLYEWYQKLTKANYYITAVVLIAVFFCYADFKKIYKDKRIYALLICNGITFIGVINNIANIITALTVLSLTIVIYLSDKITLGKIERRILEIFFAAFFIYWTIDVKGYFKGYSTNFGGLVLIGGFLYLVIIIEKLRNYYVLGEKGFLSKYPYYFTLVEVAAFIVAYRIIAWYQSRTAAVTLFVFAILLLSTRLILSVRIIRSAVTIVVLSVSAAFPAIYIYLTDNKLLDDTVIFTKPLVSSRYENWTFLYSMIKQHPIVGNGTIFVSEGTSFREGLLDTCNGFLQLAVPNGLIIAAMLYIILAVVLLKQSGKIQTRLQAIVYVALLSMIVCSSSESFFVSQPFILFFASGLFILNSVIDEKEEVSTLNSEYKIICKKEFRDKLVPVFCVTAMIMLMYIILGPLEIFYSNYSEFEFNTGDFIWYFVIISVAVSLTVSLVLASLPAIVSRVYCVIFFSAGLGSYIQYMFINGDLVDDEGNFVLELNVGFRYNISIILFILCILFIAFIAVKFKKKVIYVFSLGSLILSVIMLTAIVSIGVSLLGMENKKSEVLGLNATDEFTYAKNENTIVIVMDTFGRTVLNEEMAEDKNCIDFLHDFTFYKNHDSVYCPTFPSLFHLLTEYEYSEDEREEYARRAFESDSSKAFFNKIHDAGYKTGIYSLDIHPLDSVDGLIDNVCPCTITVNKNKVRSVLYTLSMYRYLPYNLKRHYQLYNPKVGTVAYSITEPALTNDSFFSRMNEWGMQVDETLDKKFTLNHMFGVHSPILNDENCNRVEEGSVSRHERTRGVLKAVSVYLENLKNLGIYDSSTIIVMADHGEYGNTDSVFFEKKPYEEHEVMAVDDSNITHHDFQRIIIDSLR